MWLVGDEEVDVVALAGEPDKLAVQRRGHLARSVLGPRQHRCGERFTAVLDAEREMQGQRVDAGRTGTGSGAHEPIVAGRRYRLYLTPEQERRAALAAGCCRAIWNAALEQPQLAWKLCAESVWGIEQMAELPELKRSEGFEWLREDGIAQSLQQTIRDLDVAYRRWLAGLGGRPRSKAKGRDESFRLPQARDLPVRKLNRRWAEVRLPKLGWCRFRLTRTLGGAVRHATVSRDAFGWQVSFCVEPDQRSARPNGKRAVGLDRGVAATVALSTRELRHCPTLPAHQAERLRRLCRMAGRQETRRRRRATAQRRRRGAISGRSIRSPSSELVKQGSAQTGCTSSRPS